MPVDFSRTTRALHADAGRESWILYASLLSALAAWSVWFGCARVTVYARSERARLEAAQVGHRVQTPLEGHVVAVRVRLAQHVMQGDVLAQLDATEPQYRLEQRQVEHNAAVSELRALRVELSKLQHALARTRRAGKARTFEARVRTEQARVLALDRADERERSGRLYAVGALSQQADSRARSDAEQQERETAALSAAEQRVTADQRLAQADRSGQVAQIATRIAALEGRVAELEVTMRQLQAEIRGRAIVAPVSGVIGDVAALTPGSFVHSGDLIAVVVPESELRVVAELPADQALGRVQRGQRGQLRLSGFPFTQFGSIHGVVAQVGQEQHEGRVRVELSLDASTPRIPLQHALPGALQIELEQVAPVTLAMRAVGRAVMPRSEPGR